MLNPDLLVLIHNDIDNPFPKPGKPNYLTGMIRILLKDIQNTTIIWAHLGLGRIINPIRRYGKEMLMKCLQTPDTIIFTLIFHGMKLLNGLFNNDNSIARTSKIN